MQEGNIIQQDNKRIAKNTFLLYLRTILVMFVALYTSRVVLNTLGIEDYGVYTAVGGVVSMFSVISGALTNAISRFITFDLGKGNIERLSVTFATSINIQIVISIIIFLLCEIFGVWFLNAKMNIPLNRMGAANWVLQCSLITFVINLISVPYNAAIVAHEHMGAFAYISIVETVLKLVIVYLLVISGFDKLITYAILLVAVSIIIRVTYGIYCNRHFKECKYRFVYDSSLFRKMLAFSGWNFLSNSAYVFNNQGVNMLINIFFGVVMNSARGIASQVENIIFQFVNNFTMAINPQITKSYAQGDRKRLFYLIDKGARFSFFLLLFFSLPVMFEAEYLLTLWLKIVPEKTAMFLVLSFIGAMISVLGNTGYTACMATGNIKKYTLGISSLGALVFCLSWIAYVLGAPVESTYIVFIIVYAVIQVVRLIIMKELLGYPPTQFFREVICRIIPPCFLSCILPAAIVSCIPTSFLRLLITTTASLVTCTVSIYYTGLTKSERRYLVNRLEPLIYRIQHKKFTR